MTLLVVVGAGASYDSVAMREPGLQKRSRVAVPNDPALPSLSREDEQARPPLAAQLFDPRPEFSRTMRELPGVEQLAVLLQRRPAGQSVEAALDELVASAASYPRALEQLIQIRFYLAHIVGDCERRWYHASPAQLNMQALVELIERRRGKASRAVFVTFNYDCIIEHTLKSYDGPFRAMSDYVGTSRTPVIKLHGSVDWIRFMSSEADEELPRGRWERVRHIAREYSAYEPPREAQLKSATNDQHLERFPWVPAIAVPLTAKAEFECPRAHVERLRHLLPSVRSVLTLGWRGGESAFLEMVREGVPRGVPVQCASGSTNASHETATNLADAFPASRIVPFDGGFSAMLEERAMAETLEAAWR